MTPARTQARAVGLRRALRRPSAAWLALLILAAAAPFFLSEIQLFTAARIAIFIVWGLSLNLLLGQTGLVSFAHAAYFGVGAYSVALAFEHLDWSPLLGLAITLPVGALVALVTGLIALRAVHLYFALLTLALSQLLYVIVFQWREFTRGDDGIHGIEVPSWLDPVYASYWFILAIAVFGVVALATIARSPFGAALFAIRENRQRAGFVGIHVKRYELAAFVIAGSFSALAGAMFAIFNREAFPNLLLWTANATPIFIVLIGGMHRFAGPIVGAFAFVLLEETVTQNTLYSDLVLGGILLVIVLLAPGGLTGVAEGLWQRARGQPPPEEPTPVGPAGEEVDTAAEARA